MQPSEIKCDEVKLRELCAKVVEGNAVEWRLALIDIAVMRGRLQHIPPYLLECSVQLNTPGRH